MGDGPLEPLVRRASDVNTNVCLVPAVPPTEVLSYTVGADIGVCAIEDICQSYHLSLPNKLFEYIAAGLPLVVFPRPDQVEIIDNCGNGWVVAEDLDSLVEFLDSLDRRKLKERQANATAAMGRFAWEHDASQYPEIFA